MIDTNRQREIIVKGLKDYLECEVIRTNQTALMPKFPYVGYNIITLSSENNGTWAEWIGENKAVKPITQTYSFTSYSDDYEEAVNIANSTHDWVDLIGTLYLNDNSVTVQSITGITDRSNLLSNGYLYSFGFDCFFWVYDEIDLNTVDRGQIDTIEFS